MKKKKIEDENGTDYLQIGNGIYYLRGQWDRLSMKTRYSV